MGIPSQKLIVLFMVVSSLAMVSMATLEDDEKECADQLTSLASCIPFVSGSAKKPTQECCQDTQKLKASKPKCLCVLIKESTDPSMGLPINTTLALQMPAACNMDASVSNCPTLLNIPADSPDAKIFKDAGGQDSPKTDSTSTPAASPSSSKSTSSSSSSSSSPDSTSKSDSATSATPSSAGAKMKLFKGAGVFIVMASIALIFV